MTVAMFPSPPYLLLNENDDNGNATYPYGIVFDYIFDTLSRCCPEKTELVLNNEALVESDVIFPVTEDDETFLTFSGVSYTFYDIVKVDDFVLIGLIDQYNAKARGLVLRSLYDSWPSFVLIFLLTGIAGIFIWALEYHMKNEEFSLSFTRGSYDGFWWAFISMTTVGYGDKSPRSFFGRLFGVFWILTGLVVITMFTATVTSALLYSSSPEFINGLEGLEVAVLNGSFAEAEATYLGAGPRPYPKFEEMHAAMVNEEVEGLFLERLQAYYFYSDNDFYDDDNFRVFHTVPTKISYKMAFEQ
ncbi:potassium voltage-gated channel subfamily A member 1-like isoform X2 [Stylophora pistillata]|nr:potassium voltage-gated channel subfamily A member 1-like isoform X2 [Stylophora pistillata]